MLSCMLHHIGLGFESLGDFERAVDAYRKALSFAPGDQKIAKRLALASAKATSSRVVP